MREKITYPPKTSSYSSFGTKIIIRPCLTFKETCYSKTLPNKGDFYIANT